MTDQNQPTRTPPTEPGDWELPVVELWEGTDANGRLRFIVKRGERALIDGWYPDENWEAYVEKIYTNLRRTHTCKWEPCDE